MTEHGARPGFGLPHPGLGTLLDSLTPASVEWIVWPGGRRLPDETYAATARREVHEETGWLIEEPDLRLLGFVHMRHTRPQPGEHDRGQGDNWVDLDGRELGHRLVTPKELAAVELSAAQRAFLNVLQDSGAP